MRLFSLLIGLLLLFPPFLEAQSFPPIDPNNIQIARDEWGVPHIFAPTDAEAAYGLAWANAEDGFETIQQTLMIAKGMMGRGEGVKGAPVDFFRKLIRADEMIERDYERVLTPEFRRYIDGYCQGANAFAEKYPERIHLKKLFPVKPKEILQAYLVSFAFLCGVSGEVEAALNGKFDEEPLTFGSNAFALKGSRTKEGHTYICSNPHFQIEGPLSFYEAHLYSEEGLNVLGAIFQGGTSIFIGANENLAWGMTYNYFDKSDSYRLKMHPRKKRHYLFDGEWKKLEKKPIWLKIKVKKWLTIPVKRRSWQSVHGPVLRSKKGAFYAIRAPSTLNIQAAQEYYYMNKASNFQEFRKALEMQGVPMFNIVYADKDDNIYYLHNGLMAKRDPSYDWSKPVPGHSSKNLWTECYSIDELQHVLNPDCGYVFNTNNTPSNASCAAENFPADRLPAYSDGRPGNNNRAERFMELIEEKDLFSFEDFKAMKFDNQFPKNSTFLQSIKPLFEIDSLKHPELAHPIRLLHEWDRTADSNSVGASIVAIALNYVFEKTSFSDKPFVVGVKAEPQLFVEGIAEAQRHLREHFGTVEVPLKEVYRFVRNGKDHYAPGFPDLLMASYARKYKEGKFSVNYGDSYAQFVAFSKEGVERIESILPFNTLPTAEDYSSQLALYQQHKAKIMTLDKKAILDTALKIYHPK